MTSVEIIALVIVALSVVKLIVLMVNPQAWFNTAGRLIGTGWITRIVLLILGAIVLKYLMTELTIVQIYAASAFTIIIFWLSLAPYKQKMWDAVISDMTTGNMWRRAWFTIAIWILLTLWVVKEIF